jgi:protein-glutamine gamma-glutamyltransferase
VSPRRPFSEPGQALAPVVVARGVAVLGLVLFGGLHWMQMLAPAAGFRAWEAAGIAVALMAGLARAERLRARGARWAAAGALVLVGFALALLAGGSPDEYLRPDRWGSLAAGLVRGVETLPGARVPFLGLDEWTRITLAAGGTVLAVVGAGLAFWPRSGRRMGFRIPALFALVTLYVVPTVALILDAEFLRGAVLALLVVAYLRLERLRRPDARAAALVAAAVALVALAVAPALDRSAPWWDYETWAQDTSASKSTSFSWDHDYRPLKWPRDGRELLRVKAQRPAYWKAENLDSFEGATWQRSEFVLAPDEQVPATPGDRRGRQRIRVTVRNLESRQVVTAGAPLAVASERAVVQSSPGNYVTTGRPLHRGDAYEADVYTPEADGPRLRAAGTAYQPWLDGYRSIGLSGAGVPSSREDEVRFAVVGDERGPRIVNRRFPGYQAPAEERLAGSGLRRTWELSRRLRDGAGSPYAYVRRVEAYLAGDQYSYTETPPASAGTLDGFLFDAKAGFCQQYSGAMALLLRMGGVPARVSTGFTSGSLDSKTNEYVVRDLDAHSWVEAWFPGTGWVTFDPTPSAAPPRSQSADAAARPSTLQGPAARLGLSDRTSDPATPLAATGGGFPWEPAGLAVAVLALASGLLLRARGRRRRGAATPPPWGPALAELERALRRTRRRPAGGTTLHGLEDGFARSPVAAGYVRALRDQRYRPGAPGPTGAQRRGLRSELARGAGPAGWLRAWWALPPRAPRNYNPSA